MGSLVEAIKDKKQATLQLNNLLEKQLLTIMKKEGPGLLYFRYSS